MQPALIKALRRQPTGFTPIWIMRQAGRYLPSYRAVREKYSFHEMVYTPEVAAEVTLQPVEQIGVDAAILFSDILVIPEALGMRLQFVEGKGPVFEEPIRRPEQVDILPFSQAAERLHPVYDAVRIIRSELGGRAPLIGFAGAPWTLAAYMIEGQGSKEFRHARAFLYAEPVVMHRLLQGLTEAIVDYLRRQVEAGAQALQIFDSWAGYLTPEQFRMFALPYLRKIVEALSDLPVPIIVFARGAAHALAELSRIGADALSIDWQTDLQWAKTVTGGRVALQGNLDPIALYAPKDVLKREVERVLQKYGTAPGHVFNLGHGILPDAPVDHVKALVDFVHELSPKYHGYETVDA